MAPESTGHSTSHTSSSIYYSTWSLPSPAGSTAGRLISGTSEPLSNSQKRVWERTRETVWLIMQNWARSLGDQAIHCCYSLENDSNSVPAVAHLQTHQPASPGMFDKPVCISWWVSACTLLWKPRVSVTFSMSRSSMESFTWRLTDKS